MGQERDEGSRLCRVYTARMVSSRSTVYPPGTYLRRSVHVYLLHGCSSQFALRPLDFRRGAFDARNNFFFPSPPLSLWPRPVRRTKRGRWRDRARWLKRWRRGDHHHHRHRSSTFIFQGRIDFSGNETKLFSRSSFHPGDREIGNDASLPFSV